MEEQEEAKHEEHHPLVENDQFNLDIPAADVDAND
jgi:hypothetical protein